MQNLKYKVSFEDIRRVDVEALVDFSGHSGHEIFHTYQGVSNFKSRREDVAAVIGMMALRDVNRMGIPMGVIAQSVPSLVNAGLVELALNPENWRFIGSEEAKAWLRALITNGPEHTRREEVKKLLGIFEKRSSPFLFLDRHRVLTAGNDIGNSPVKRRQGFALVFDALGYADELRARCPGALFTIETEGGR